MERQHEVERWLLSNANHLFPTMVSDMCNGLPNSLKMILEDDTTDKLRVRCAIELEPIRSLPIPRALHGQEDIQKLSADSGLTAIVIQDQISVRGQS